MKKKKTVSRKSVETKPYAPFKAGKKKVVKKKPNLSKLQEQLAQETKRRKGLRDSENGPEDEQQNEFIGQRTPVSLRNLDKEERFPPNKKKPISKAKEDEQRSDPTSIQMKTAKSVGANSTVTTSAHAVTNLGNLKFKKAPSNLPHVVVEARAGCLAADTILNVNRCGKGFQMTIEMLVAQFNNERPTFTRVYKMGKKTVRSTQKCKPWDLSKPTYVARAVGGVIKLGKVKDAWFSGNKKTFLVTTEGNRTIRATEIHPFLMSDGTWKKLKQLKPGMQIQVNSGRSQTGRGEKEKYAMTSTRFHPNQINNGNDRYKVATHRLVVEANMNGKTLKQFLWIIKHDRERAEKLVYLTSDQIVHHKNEDSWDNDLMNLEVLNGQKEHVKEHDWGNNVLWQVGFDKIVSIEPYGEEPTYDIEVEDDPHNFIANGFVVHNTGKTFTLIVGVAWAYGQAIWDKIQREMARRINEKREKDGEHPISVEKFRVKPSAEQQKVWDALAEGRGQTKTVTYAAFNKSIVEEFGEKWGWMAAMLQEVGVTLQFCTINSLGHKACSTYYGRFKVSNFNPETVLGRVLSCDIWELKKTKPGAVFVEAVTSLVDVCKLTLVGWDQENGFDAEMIMDESLDDLVSHFDIEMPADKSKVYEAVKQVLKACHDATDESFSSSQIDYNDQNWLPVVNNLPVSQVDLLMIDESQDLPRAKQEFARLVGRRIICVGDVNQAIYGFAGADVESIPRMKTLLKVGESLKLTSTYRCAKSIVREANQIVPDFYAHEDNPEGLVTRSKMDQYAGIAVDGDMVLCRVNAPLVSQALKFVRDGRKAIIRGRDFGKSLIKFVESMGATSVGQLIERVQDWADHQSMLESAKRNASEQKLISIQDKRDCIEAFCEYDKLDGTEMTVQDVVKKIQRIFAGKICPRCNKSFDDDANECWTCKVELVRPAGVLFSSVHKSKGLESSRVFILQPKGASIPHPMAKTQWQLEQESNLLYVAITRSINELVYVGD